MEAISGARLSADTNRYTTIPGTLIGSSLCCRPSIIGDYSRSLGDSSIVHSGVIPKIRLGELSLYAFGVEELTGVIKDFGDYRSSIDKDIYATAYRSFIQCTGGMLGSITKDSIAESIHIMGTNNAEFLVDLDDTGRAYPGLSNPGVVESGILWLNRIQINSILKHDQYKDLGIETYGITSNLYIALSNNMDVIWSDDEPI